MKKNANIPQAVLKALNNPKLTVKELGKFDYWDDGRHTEKELTDIQGKTLYAAFPEGAGVNVTNAVVYDDAKEKVFISTDSWNALDIIGFFFHRPFLNCISEGLFIEDINNLVKERIKE